MWNLFKRRDRARFPDDEVGNTLYKLTAKGTEGMPTIGIDLTFGFRSEADATAFAGQIGGPKVQADIVPPDDAQAGEWRVETMREAVSTHSAVTEVIARARAEAREARGTLARWHLFW